MEYHLGEAQKVMLYVTNRENLRLIDDLKSSELAKQENPGRPEHTMTEEVPGRDSRLNFTVPCQKGKPAEHGGAQRE